MSKISSRPKIQRVIHNDKCGYSIIFFEREEDSFPKDPEVFLHKDDSNLDKLRAAGKPVSNLPDDLRQPNNQSEEAVRRAIAHNKIVEIQDTFSNIKNYYKKAEDHDLSRRKIIAPTVRRSMRGRSADEICDILLQDVMKNNDYVFSKTNGEKSSKEWKNSWRRKVSQERRTREEKQGCEMRNPCNMKKTCEVKKVCEKVCEEKKVCPGCTCTCACRKKEELKAEPVNDQKECRKSPTRLILPNLDVLKPVDTAHTRHQRHLEMMRQREYELDLFDKTFSAHLRRLRNDIKDLELKYL